MFISYDDNHYTNPGKNRDHTDQSIVENTWKSPGVMKRLAVTQTSMKNYLLNWGEEFAWIKMKMIKLSSQENSEHLQKKKLQTPKDIKTEDHQTEFKGKERS